MKKTKENNGITLIALIITIIILLILAGITISSLTNSGLFSKTEQAKEQAIKAQLKEEIEMAIQEIQIEELPKGNNVTLETLANGQLVEKLIEITAELCIDEITGEYKDYDYTIDSNLKVEIGGKVGGIKPTGTAEILTTSYMFEGDGAVEIKVTANITEGTITGIEAPEGAILVTDTSNTEKIYKVEKSGRYVFKITGDSGRKINVIANVENILETPKINISEITENSFKINVENNYPEGIITEYKYYVENEIKNEGTANTNYTVTGLTEGTEYSNIKVVVYINSSTSKESNIETVTTGIIETITVSEAQSDEMLTKTENTNVKDENGNILKLPAGFKIKVDETTDNVVTIDKGIVIVDSDENEFVWIPVGKIYTDVSRTEENAKTIELNRTFGDQSDYAYFTELATSTLGNTTAKDLEAFKTSAINNKGYYIGRYEARTATERSAGTDTLTQVTEKGSEYVYNYVTQPQAAQLCQDMYTSTKFTSDLMNSYAWDTAIIFLQICGTNSTYSKQKSLNSSLATTGTNNTTTKDVQCNVYDMASNVVELTTETSKYSGQPCVYRGGLINNKYHYTVFRYPRSTSINNGHMSFRPILYL